MPIYGNYILNENKSLLNKRLYFLSNISMNEDKLQPKIPDNFFTKNGYEDNKTPRVCFAPSINQCLMGLSQNLKGAELFVHIIDPDIDDKKFKKIVYYPTVEEVPDVKITGEVWIIKPVSVKLIGKIKVIKDSGKPGHTFVYGDGKISELYDWDFEWIWKEE